MLISFTSRFQRHFKKRTDEEAQRMFHKKLSLFQENPHHARLDNHALKGEWSGFRSIDVTRDYRAIFQDCGEDHYLFVDFGSHDQLYKKRS